LLTYATAMPPSAAGCRLMFQWSIVPVTNQSTMLTNAPVCCVGDFMTNSKLHVRPPVTVGAVGTVPVSWPAVPSLVICASGSEDGRLSSAVPNATTPAVTRISGTPATAEAPTFPPAPFSSDQYAVGRARSRLLRSALNGALLPRAMRREMPCAVSATQFSPAGPRFGEAEVR
jgi:hypothetical protein